jgi:hypothetical protein
MNKQELSPSEAQNLKFEGMIMFCLVSAVKSQSVQWYVSMEKCWIHEQREKTEENWRKKSAWVPVHSPWILHKVKQEATAATQSQDST